MSRLSRFSIARGDIIKTFDALGKTYYTAGDLSEILNRYRTNWRLTKSMQVEEFAKELTSKTPFRKIMLPFPARTYLRYAYRDFSVMTLAAQLSAKSYLSHYTALSLHGLTEQIPKIIYVTDEQSPKATLSSLLTQESIDQAFAKKPRASSSLAQLDGLEICLLKGKSTDNLGVTETVLDGQEVRYTDLERTLIDSTVRPHYAGGISEVLKAYEAAMDLLAVNKLSAMLKKLSFIYPYEQAVGFYLERAGYKKSLVSLFRKEKYVFDFYLAYTMEQKKYNADWAIWYPEGF